MQGLSKIQLVFLVLTLACTGPVVTAEASPCPTGLIAQYEFDGDVADATDPTNADKNAILAGDGGQASLSSDEKVSGSHSLRLLSDAGTNTYAILPSFQVGTTITISTWFQWNLATSYDTSYQKLFFFTDTGKAWKFYINRPLNSKNLDVTLVYSGGWCNYKPTTDFQDNVWYHFVVSIDDTAGMKVYVDGTYQPPVTGSTQCTWPATSDPITFDENYLGRHQSENKDNFDGYIDDFQIYDAELSAAEVQTLYQEGSSSCSVPAETDCDAVSVSYWSIRKSTCS